MGDCYEDRNCYIIMFLVNNSLGFYVSFIILERFGVILRCGVMCWGLIMVFLCFFFKEWNCKLYWIVGWKICIKGRNY